MIKKPDFHFPPPINKLKRGGPAITQPKDAGLVIAYTGIGKNSRVLELGCGSGFMTVQLGRIVNEIVSYEKKAEFIKIAEINAKIAGLDNVIFKLKDVLEGIDEKSGDFDLVFCDIAEPEKTIEDICKALRRDGYLVGYCLQAEQAKALHLAAEKYFSEVYTIESLTREYEVREFGFRPKHFGLLYTAYLVFARK